MKRHPSDTILALSISGDLDLRDRFTTIWHVRTCPRCAKLVQSFRDDAEFFRASAEEIALPANWDSLAEEMAANIRLGLSASECIRDVKTSRPQATARPATAVRPDWFWKPAAGIALAMATVVMVWFSTMPPEQTRVFARVWDAAVHGRTSGPEPLSTVLESSASGIEMRRGSRTSVSVLVEGRKPEQFSANLDGSMRAQYVDDDSGQVTVTNVYSQ